MRNKIARLLSRLAEEIDLAISNHVRTPSSKCKWYCKPGARIADKIRFISNKIWKK